MNETKIVTTVARYEEAKKAAYARGYADGKAAAEKATKKTAAKAETELSVDGEKVKVKNTTKRKTKE